MFLAILGVIGVFLLMVELNLMKEKFSIKFNKALDKELVINIYNRITNLPMSFYAMRTTGDIQARYSDGDSLRGTITRCITRFFGRYCIRCLGINFSVRN